MVVVFSFVMRSVVVFVHIGRLRTPRGPSSEISGTGANIVEGYLFTKKSVKPCHTFYRF